MRCPISTSQESEWTKSGSVKGGIDLHGVEAVEGSGLRPKGILDMEHDEEQGLAAAATIVEEHRDADHLRHHPVAGRHPLTENAIQESAALRPLTSADEGRQ